MSRRSMIFLIALLLVMGVLAGVSIYFWKKQSSSHHHASATLAVEVQYNMTVSKTRPGAFKTVMEALSVAPTHSDEMFYIHIAVGVYIESVVIPVKLTNIVLVGDGEGVTNITMNRHAPEFGAFRSGTVTVFYAGFAAKFITIESSTGPGSQVVAIVNNAEDCAFYKCTFLGYQDTLYAELDKQLFRECDIYGTIDFIFAETTAVFQSYNVFAQAPNLICFTAQGKRNSFSLSAFVFQNSFFNVAPGIEPQISDFVAYFGQPWFNYSTIVVKESYLGAIISPAEWEKWTGNPTDQLTTKIEVPELIRATK